MVAIIKMAYLITVIKRQRFGLINVEGLGSLVYVLLFVFPNIFENIPILALNQQNKKKVK